MKIHFSALLIGFLLASPSFGSDSAREVAEIRRLLDARGSHLGQRAAKLLEKGNPQDIRQLRRQLQHAPLKRSRNIGQGRTVRTKPAPSRKLNARRKL